MNTMLILAAARRARIAAIREIRLCEQSFQRVDAEEKKMRRQQRDVERRRKLRVVRGGLPEMETK